jgi:hypothetical protein
MEAGLGSQDFTIVRLRNGSPVRIRVARLRVRAITVCQLRRSFCPEPYSSKGPNEVAR